MRLRTLVVTALCLAMASTTAYGQKKKLSVGDPAPGLDIEAWVKGSETSLKEGQVYIVEFWATWCGPCKKSIPHLTQLQKDYGDQGLTIIGISDEEVDVVRPWVKGQGSNMDYTVAVDRRKSTKRAWFEAAGLRGIPAAFIVGRDGRIAFIGNPHPNADGPEMDSILKKVLAGRYDPKLQKQAEPKLRAARNARKVRNWRMALKQYDEVIELSPSVFAEVALERFEMLLVDQEDSKSAYLYARLLMNSSFSNDAGALQMLAMKITTDPTIEQKDRDLNIAMEAAQKANLLTRDRDPEYLSSLAAVHYHRGELSEAVDLQKRAWMLVKPKSKAEYRHVLRQYQEAVDRTAMNPGK